MNEEQRSGQQQDVENRADTETFEDRLRQLEQEKKELYDRYVRQAADFDNFRKRVDRESREARKHAEADLVAALLPVLDAFERALATPAGETEDYRRGVELIYKQLWDALARAGLKPVDAVGKPFDPFVHHAVERVESTTHSDQAVVAELQRGYLFKERLLRPALVKVAVAPGAAEAESPAGADRPQDE